MANLQDYLNSDYIRNLRPFSTDRTRVEVLVYVEGDDDVAFWTHALNQYGDSTKYKFSVTTNKGASVGGVAANGKEQLMRIANLGPHKIVCVDADFDLLIDAYSNHSERVRVDPYVVHTTCYAIESILADVSFYQSFFQSLGISVQTTEYEDQLKWISLTCLDLFLLLLSFAKEESRHRSFGFKDFAACLNTIKKGDVGNWGKYSYYKNRWRQEYASLFDSKQHEISSIHQRILQEGFSDEHCYAFMNGHELYNLFIRPLWEKRLIQSIDSKIEAFKENHKGLAIAAYKTQCYQELGGRSNLKAVLDHSYYHNKPVPLQLPDKTANKITDLFSTSGMC